MDASEHERLSNITRTQHKLKEQRLYSCSTFHSRNRVFSNEINTYTKMSAKRYQAYI